MEHLNKQQLILLALLVSFITSIATGIVTVSLMSQAPPGVTQTINRVVEKTIERVVTEPAASKTAAVVSKETVVVKADDLVIEAIEKNVKSVVRIKEVTGEGESKRQTFAGLGLLVSKEGLIAADISAAYSKSDTEGNSIPKSYIGVFADGRVFPLNIALSEQAAGVIFFSPLIQDRDKGTFSFPVPAFSSSALKLGQAVVAIAGEDSNTVSTGIISNLVRRAPPKTAAAEAASSTSTPAAEGAVTAIKTDLRSADLVTGAALLNLSGEVIGLNIGAGSAGRGAFSPIGAVLDILVQGSAGASLARPPSAL